MQLTEKSPTSSSPALDASMDRSSSSTSLERSAEKPRGNLVSDRQVLSQAEQDEASRIDKALVWKIDRTLVPFLTLLFLMSFLDRINIGVAKLAGLSTDLKLTSLQYTIASTIFFVSYVAFEIPSNLVLKKFRPSRWIPFIMVLWAITQTMMGLVKNYHQLLALRFLLGLFESGLFPGISMYLGMWYKRREQSLRIALFFSAATLAGAFGGILGWAIAKMAGVGGKNGWSWIFIIEGLMTFVIACIAPFFVHDFPEQAKFLTEEERKLVLDRLHLDTGVANAGTFSWQRVKDALTDYKTWLFMLIYIGCAEPIYSQSLFSPTVVASLGRWTTSQSLLLTVPPYVLAFFTTVATAILSDRYGNRGYFMMFWSSLALIGYIILVTVPIHHPGVLYFAIFLTVASIAPQIAITITWTSNNFGNHYKKAMAMGMVFSLGNSGGIVSSQVYRPKDTPSFKLGHGVTLGFCAMGFICSTIVHLLMKRENKRRDELYGLPPTPLRSGEVHDADTLQRLGLNDKSEEEIIAMGDKRPDFRYIL
uniref:MFS transporter n=1 Tax=Phaffia rhodozyma TaxID=264483 RepID=A0A1I9Q6Z7_PHARH|nr:MFS transporter [Phaffia rhodozyma]